MRIPCVDGVVSRGRWQGESRVGRSEEERNYAIIVKRDGKKMGNEKRTIFFFFWFGKLCLKPMEDNRPPHGLASASPAPSGDKVAELPFGYLQVAP